MISDPAPTPRDLPSEGESWLFISYSRTTSELAQGLTDDLEARGYRVWIDQESITPASDWRARISVGIEGARAVILIISERFIASPNCDRELVEAVGLGKRLIPILAENIPIERLPEPVPDLDLIMAVDADPAQVIDEVVEAVETDLEWLDEHTRLLQASLRWAETPEDRSLLLRGNDLKAVRAQVTAASALAPTVTQVQQNFLTACEDNRIRLRNLSWAAGLAATAIIGLAGIATVQRAAAVEARTGAEAQRIAADAEAVYDTQLDLGLSLALTARSWDPSLATESSLLRGLTAGPGLRATTQVTAGRLTDAVFTDPGRSIVLADADGVASTWSEPGSVVELAGGVLGVASGPDGVVTVTADAVSLPDGESCPNPGRMSAVETAPWGVVIAVDEGTGSRVIALEPTCVMRELAVTEARVASFGRSPTGRMAWGTQRGELSIVDGTGAAVDGDLFEGAGVTAITFSTSDQLAVGLDNGTLALAGVEIAQAHEGAVTAIRFVAEGVVSAGADGWIRLWSPSGRLTLELTNLGPNRQANTILDLAQWSAGALVSVDVAGRAQGWDLTGRSPLANRLETAPGIGDVASVEGGFVALGQATVTGGVEVPDATLTAVGVVADNLVFGDDSGGIWQQVSGDEWERTQGRSGNPVRLIADGSNVVWADETVRSEGQTWEVTARALVSVGDLAYAATSEGEVLALGPSGSEIAFAGHQGTVDALDVSPDGTLVASGGDDRLIYVWERDTGVVVHGFVGHTDRVIDLAFSPDGTRLVSVGEDDRMIIWDFAARSMVGSPISHPGEVRMEAVVWESNSSILTGGSGLYRWAVGADDLDAAACGVIGPRVLTDAEVAQYLSEVEPEVGC